VSKKTLASKTKLLKTGIHLLHFEELPLSNVQIQIITEHRNDSLFGQQNILMQVAC
jgi:hypothetical protein